jgi:serine/threonine protein kinase
VQPLTSNLGGMTGPDLLGGRYELRGVLGRGGMAEVRDGWDTRLNRAVAIKQLHPGFNAQPDIQQRFQVEARAAAGLNHPNIVAVHDCGEHDGVPFIVMERLPGGTLADQIAQGPLPQARVQSILGGVLAALATAHAAGILHRDIKPGNILIAPGGRMKLADFGLAKSAGAAHTMTGQIVGTLAYLSPERLAGVPASVADDLYAVGIVGYEALAGRQAFAGDNIAALVHAILHDHPPPLHTLRPDVDPRLALVIGRAMARDSRFTSADDMRAALNENEPVAPLGAPVAPAVKPPTKVLDAPPVSGTYLPPMSGLHPAVSASASAATKRKRLLGAAAILVVLTLSGLAFALDSSSSQPGPEPVGTSTPATSPVSSQPPPPPSAEPVTQQPSNQGPAQVPGNGKKPKGPKH